MYRSLLFSEYGTQNLALIKEGIAVEFEEKITFINTAFGDLLNESQNRALNDVNEKYLLHVDMDEFLYLNGMTLPQFMKSERLNGSYYQRIECHFRWVMSPFFKTLYAPSIKDILNDRYFFPSRDGKSMAATHSIKKIGVHRHAFKSKKIERNYDNVNSNCFIFHASARGIYDIINKIQFGQYTCVKKSINPADELRDLIFNENSKLLPKRFVLLAFQNKFNPYILDIDYQYPHLSHATDTALLKKITLDGLKDLLGVAVSEEHIEKVITKKINHYNIPEELVAMYASGDTNLLSVLEEISKNN